MERSTALEDLRFALSGGMEQGLLPKHHFNLIGLTNLNGYVQRIIQDPPVYSLTDLMQAEEDYFNIATSMTQTSSWYDILRMILFDVDLALKKEAPMDIGEIIRISRLWLVCQYRWELASAC